MTRIFLLLPLAMLLLAGRAVALTLEEARSLVREANLVLVESVFADHQAAFDRGEITAADFTAPYRAFRTTDPTVLELVDAWRKARPDSAQAMVAKAATLIHVAMIVRGERVIIDTPPNSLARMGTLYAEARPLLMRALDLEPRQVYAADLIEAAGAFTGDRAGRQRASTVLHEHGDPEGVLLDDLNHALPQWGGSEEKMRALCKDAPQRVPTISEAECNAMATLDLDVSGTDVIEAALETLAAKGDDHWVSQRADGLLRLRRYRDALDLLERNRTWIGWSDAFTLARGLRDGAVARRSAEQWLAIDPYHPRHLANLTWALDLEGDTPGAVAAADKALRFGATIPEVRTARMYAIAKDEDRKWGLLDDFEDAIAQTTWHHEVTNMATAALYRPFPYLTHRRDGTPTPDFECRRLRIFVQHAAACAKVSRMTGTRRTCHPDGLQKVVVPMLNEAKRAGKCRDMNKTTWRQLVEKWLQ